MKIFNIKESDARQWCPIRQVKHKIYYYKCRKTVICHSFCLPTDNYKLVFGNELQFLENELEKAR